jgi:hypothetical protein
MRSFINLYVLQNTIKMIQPRKMRWAGHVACMEQMLNAHYILVEKREGKRQLGRPRHRWDDNIRMDLRKIEWEVVDCIPLAQVTDKRRALMIAVMNLRVP